MRSANLEAGERTAADIIATTGNKQILAAPLDLASGLHRALALAGAARVVSVSSSAHLRSPVVFEDIHFREREYEPWLAIAVSPYCSNYCLDEWLR